MRRTCVYLLLPLCLPWPCHAFATTRLGELAPGGGYFDDHYWRADNSEFRMSLLNLNRTVYEPTNQFCARQAPNFGMGNFVFTRIGAYPCHAVLFALRISGSDHRFLWDHISAPALFVLNDNNSTRLRRVASKYDILTRSTDPPHVGVRLRIFGLAFFEPKLNLRQCGFLKPCRSIDNRSRLLTGGRSHGNDFGATHSADSKIATVSTTINLALLQAWKGPASIIERYPIRTNHYFLGAQGNHDDGSHANHRGTKRHQEPKYLRRNETGSVSFIRTDAGQLIDVIDNADIDVSYDGRVWFHLLGEKCIKNCNRLHINPQSDHGATILDP